MKTYLDGLIEARSIVQDYESDAWYGMKALDSTIAAARQSEEGREMNGLLPCPFCGGAPKVFQETADYEQHRTWSVECPKCEIAFTSENEARAAWNRRAFPTPNAKGLAGPHEEEARNEARKLAERAGIDMLDDHDQFINDLTETLLRFAALRAQQDAGTFAARDVLFERERQVSVEGWTPDHDDGHDKGEMATAAACYAIPDGLREIGLITNIPRLWPKLWLGWWKPKDKRTDLVRAGALIIAEIERLDRALAPPEKDKPR